MKTIEPNSDEDLLNQYFATSLEMIQFCGDPKKALNIETIIEDLAACDSRECFIVIGTYKNCLRFLEKNIKERQLYN
jgi:hypothetical protein